jgi:outer membrane lipoprotein SlyB
MNKQSPVLPFQRHGAAWLVAAVAAAALSACAVPVTQTRRVIDGPEAVPMAPMAYARYGTVTRIEEIDTRVGNSGGGAALGGVIGGVVGNQMGRGTGRAAATVLGIFGGAIVGDNVERSNAAAASGTIYRVFVRFDDGTTTHYDYRGLGGLHSGERVRLEHGTLNRA